MPESVRSVRCATTPSRLATSPRLLRRRTTSSAPRRRRAFLPATRRTSCASTCQAWKLGTSPTIGTAVRREPWPPGAPMGRFTRIRVPRSTSTSRRIACPAPTRNGPSAASSAGCDSRPSGRGPACSRTNERSRARARTGTGCCGRPGSIPSPVVGLYEDASGTSAAILATIAAGRPAIDLHDSDDVRHRLWIAEAEGDAGEHVGALIAAAGAEPVTIADGHHRYETALRYRDERRMSRSCEEDPAFDYLLMLFLETTSEPLTVLPTHRLVRGLGTDGLARLGDQPRSCSNLGRREWPSSSGRSATAWRAAGPGGSGSGRGMGDRSSRPAAMPSQPSSAGVAPAVRQLDVWLLGVALERLFGIDDAAVAGGERISYTKSVARRGRPGGPGRGRGRCRLPARADARAIDHDRGSVGRGDAPEVDVFLSQGPDRARHQPARMVKQVPMVTRR